MKINEKNLCTFASTPPYDLEGFLNKRGVVNKSWQKRYFVLKGNLLFYFERKGDKDPLGLIIVEGCTIELSEDCDQFSFQIVFNGNRSYILSAESQSSMELWMKALTCAGYEYKKLMVTALQLQLEELNKKNRFDLLEPTPSFTPTAPPRRQNPFNRTDLAINRPAPPPPIPLVADGSAAINRPAPAPPLVSNGLAATNRPALAAMNIVSDSMAVDIASILPNTNEQRSTKNFASSSFYGHITSPGPGSAPSNQIFTDKPEVKRDRSPNEFKPEMECSFITLHEAFRKVVYRDVDAYRSRSDPLIEF